MLFLTRNRGESVVIDHDITLTVAKTTGEVKLGFKAPPSIQIDRSEIYEKKYPDGTPDDPCMVSGLVDSVAQFHETAGVPIQDAPELPGEDRRKLRRELLEEEFREYCEAESDDDLVEIADALGDMMVIIAGTALEYGIPINDVMAEIQRSNLAKFPGGQVLRRSDGKILKPDGWEPPDVAGIISRQTNEMETN